MQAIVQEAYGPADVLQLRDIDRPVPRDDEVLVRVCAAGVGPEVWHLMAGLPYMVRIAFGPRKPRNPVPGWDVAGLVEEVGAKVTGFGSGDAVFGSGIGAFAEYCRAKADKLAPKPENLSFEQTAAIPVSGVTAATYDAQVTAVDGPTGTELVRSLGATDVIDYTREEITDRPDRYDVVLDAVGNRPLPLLRRALAPHGTLVIVGGENGGRWFGLGRQLRAKLTSPFLRQRLDTFVSITRPKDLLALKALPNRAGSHRSSTVPTPLRRTSSRPPPAGRHPRGKVVLTL
jgi:NADPH:quinone reductase-like Zn-dependent oxidoreductase